MHQFKVVSINTDEDENKPLSPDGIARKAREDNKKREIIGRLRAKGKAAAPGIIDDFLDEIEKELDLMDIDELKEWEKDTDDFLSGKDSDEDDGSSI